VDEEDDATDDHDELDGLLGRPDQLPFVCYMLQAVLVVPYQTDQPTRIDELEEHKEDRHLHYYHHQAILLQPSITQRLAFLMSMV
jgi:hypothetical protein